MLNRHLFPLFSASVLLGALLTGPAAADDWKYAIEEAINEVQGVYATKFKEHIEANSDHTVTIYPFGTLGESTDIMEQAQAGLLQFVDQSPGFTGALIPEAQVFLLPYFLPEDTAVLNEFFRSSTAIREDFHGLYRQQGLELLTMFPEGEVVMTTKEEFHSPADLNEVKFRVMSIPLLVETYKQFGAIPTPLPWGEVFGALQLNMIQGQENPTSFVESTKIYEVVDVITFTGHNTFTTAVMANADFYDGLPEDEQKLVQEASQQAFEYILGYQKDLEKKAIEAIQASKPDIKVVVLSDEERQPFRDAAQKVKDWFIQETGDSGKAILEKMEQEAAAARAKVQ